MNNAFSKFDLKGKTALVTGGGTGLGFNIARGLAQSGARVIISARREEVLTAAASKLSAETGSEVLWKTVDLASKKSTQELISYCDQVGGVDIFVGNAATEYFQTIELVTDEAIEEMFRVNVISVIEMTRAFITHMRKNQWGRILYCSSATTKCTSKQDGISVYTANKGALNTFAQTVAAETGTDGITVNSLILGIFATEMAQRGFEHMGEAGKALEKAFSSMTAVGRMGSTEEVEGLVQLLSSNAGSYITGAQIAIDGGLSIILRPNLS